MMGEINKMVEIGRSGDCVALSFTRKYIYIYGGLEGRGWDLPAVSGLLVLEGNRVLNLAGV